VATETLKPSIVKIRAVTFDVGGTLIEPWPSVGHVYAKVAAEHGVTIFSPEQLNERFKAAWRSRQTFEYSRAGWAELVEEVFGNCKPPSRTFFSELYDQFTEPAAWRIFEDVIPALDQLLSDGVRLAVISNWDERLRELLKKLDLDRYFETLAISCEVGFSKPSRAIFRHAAAKLDLEPDSILHIGDSPEMDVIGAHAAGFHALQIHRTEKSRDGGLCSLAELSAKIAQF
jgi:putative hydrolase of the HAD superfamily